MEKIEQRQLLRRRLLRQRAQDAFRPAGGARRIEHRGADGFVRDRGFGQPGGDFAQADDALAFASTIGNDAELDPGAFLERLAGDVQLRRRHDEDAGFAVVDDVGEFTRRQI